MLKRATIYALAKQALFPPPIKLGSRSSAWLETQVDDWLRERVAAAQGDLWLLPSSGLRRLRGTRRSTPEDDTTPAGIRVKAAPMRARNPATPKLLRLAKPKRATPAPPEQLCGSGSASPRWPRPSDASQERSAAGSKKACSSGRRSATRCSSERTRSRPCCENQSERK